MSHGPSVHSSNSRNNINRAAVADALHNKIGPEDANEGALDDQQPTSGYPVLGSLRSADGKGVVRIEDRYGTTIEDLWSALTDPGRLADWYGQVEGGLRPGGQFRLHVENADSDATGRIEACEPLRRLKVMTRETDESYQRGKGVPPNDEALEATLTADSDQAP